jgi:hypothetical protein
MASSIRISVSYLRHTHGLQYICPCTETRYLGSLTGAHISLTAEVVRGLAIVLFSPVNIPAYLGTCSYSYSGPGDEVGRANGREPR